MNDKPVVVIGAGPAGLVAAKAAADGGAARVVIIDREPGPGGILNQCIHTGFGVRQYKEELTGPEYAARVFDECVAAGVEFRFATTVLRTDEDLVITTISKHSGLMEVEASAIIICTGCRERARGVIHIPGERPAGIFCAGLAQKHVNIDGYLPGKRIVILGSGDIGLIMARRLTLQGAKVEAVIEAQGFVGGLARNVVQCLHDFDIPLHLSHTVTDIIGKNRVEAVMVSQVDEHFTPVPGTEFRIDCDTLLLSIGLIPENEVAETAGVELSGVTNGAIVDENYMTSVPGIFACGNALHVHDLVDLLAAEAEVVGAKAAAYANTEDHDMPSVRVTAGDHIGYVLPHRVTGKEDVKFFFRSRKPMQDVVLHANGFEKKIKFLQPNEMSSVTIPAENLSQTEEVKVWIEEN